ncbi:MAG TPA: transposase [Ktedonosporobacter sp.]|nr:transposase [Ktedonosporobacter sp.]
MAELRRVIQILQEPEERRKQGLGWSHFRRVHQAGARGCHQQRRARQAPQMDVLVPEPLSLPALPALTAALWERIGPLLPPQKPATGRPATDHRLVVEAIVLLMRTGCSWRALPERFGPWQTVVSRYERWCKEGLWARILAILQTPDVPVCSSA